MLLAGIQAISDWTPIKAFGGDKLGLRAQISSSVSERKLMKHFVVNSLPAGETHSPITFFINPRTSAGWLITSRANVSSSSP